MKKTSGERTLRASVLLSSPGPLVLGIALIYGRSATQLADLVRRTAELAAIIVSWIVFRALQKDGENDPALKRRLERAVKSGVGAALCLSGLAMLFIAFFSAHSDQQNVIPGLIIAFLGVIVNSWFWFRYGKLYREKPDAILAVQSRLYRAKTVVDVCVVLALLFVVLAPKAAITSIVDVGGSVVVALYLVRSGILTIRNKLPATE